MSADEDLSPYVYREHDHEGPVLNVGWLGEEPDFPTGDTDPEVVRGLGSAEVHVLASDGTVYAAPNLVIHYISAHGYRPPPQFVEAVLGDTAGAYQDRVEAERR